MDYKRILMIGIYLILSLMLCCNICYSQKPRSCKIEIDQSVPKYKLGSYERGINSILIIRVSLDPQKINKENLLSLSTHLKKLYCKEEKLAISFFDNYKVARHFSLNEDSIYFDMSLDSSRGSYFIDRISREEFLEYTTSSGYLRTGSKPIKIILGEKVSDLSPDK
jgi:hypothetical protein